MQRSGTTVLKDLLASHVEVSSNPEILKNARIQRDEGIAMIENLARDNHCKAIGFKLMLNQIDMNDWVVDYLLDNNYRIILIRRKPLIDIYLSHEIAKRDNRWASKRDVNVEAIQIDLADMEKQLKLIYENQLRLVRNFRNFNVFNMTYSNVNDEHYHSRILNFLGVNNFVKLSSNQKKVLRKSRENYISNYEEVMAQIEILGLDT